MIRLIFSPLARTMSTSQRIALVPSTSALHPMTPGASDILPRFESKLKGSHHLRRARPILGDVAMIR